MATLKELRLEAGFSYAELSRRANVSEPTVKRAESGDPIQEVKAAQIVRALSEALRRTVRIEDIHGLNIY
ncbi:MAG: helix-turn-helix domain-containing protein [Ktedonobacteraceae bacterium]